jgi:acyl dehydratase
VAFAKIEDGALAELRAKIGKPPSRKTPPFYTEINVDAARHFAHAIGDDNPLYCDPTYGAETKWGGQLAPPCILFSADNVVSGAIEGLPSVHAMYAGTTWTFHHAIRVGAKLTTKSYLKDLMELDTKFAGRSIKQVYAVEFYDQYGIRLADADSWVFRTERDMARDRTEKYDRSEKNQVKEYSDEEIRAVFEQYRKEQPRGKEKRLWSMVNVGDEMAPILKGPYTITAAVGFMQAWGGWAIKNNRMAFKYYDLHPRLAAPNHQNVPEPPVRVHWDNEFARAVGAPAAYDFGPERIAWLAHLVSDWMGDDGFLRKLDVQIRHHNVVGDMIWCKGRITGKSVVDGKPVVQCDLTGETGAGVLSMKGTAEVELPIG